MSIQRVEIRQTLGPISTVEVRQGPKGDHGDAGAVTNAAVNAAIATDAAATRTSLGLGSAALLTGSATFSAGGAMVWGTSKTQTLSDIWAAPKYPRAIAFSGTLETDQGTFSYHPVLRPWTALSTGYAEYSEDGAAPGNNKWSLRYQSGTWRLARSFAIPGAATWTSEATTDPDPTKVTTWTPSGRAISGTPVLYSADIITNTTLGLAFTSDKAQIASASFVAGKAILWDTTAAATRANLGITATGDNLVTAATPAAALAELGEHILRDTSATSSRSSATYTDDDVLKNILLTADTDYIITASVAFTSTGSSGYKFRLNFDQSISSTRAALGWVNQNGGALASFFVAAGGTASSVVERSAVSTAIPAFIYLHVRTGAVAPNLSLQWASYAGSADCTRNANSFITWKKL